MKYLFCVLSFSIGFAASAFAREKTVYLEEFDCLGDYVASFNDGASISESPASLKSLSFKPSTPSQARKGFFKISTPPASVRYTIHFAFNMPVGEAPRAFTLELFHGNPAKPEVTSITIAEAGSFFGNKAPVAPKDGMPGFLGAWQWNRAALAVDKGKAALHLFRNGVQVVDCTGSLPTSRLLGWNIRSSSPVSIDSVRVVDDSVRPYMIGDVADWLSTNPAIDAGASLPKNAVVLTNGQELAFAPETGSDFFVACRRGSVNRNRDCRFEMRLADGSSQAISFRCLDNKANISLRRFQGGKFENVSTNIAISDAYVLVSGPGFRIDHYVKPRLQYRYETPEVVQIAAAEGKLPAASSQLVKVRLRPLASNWTTNEVWIDSRYAGVMKLQSRPVAVMARYEGEPLCAVWSASDMVNAFADTRFLPLDVDGIGREGGAAPAIKGLPNLQTVPFIPASPARAFNLAYCRENTGSFALECNGYLSRSAFDGMPSSMHFSVPVEQYVRVHALCAVDPGMPEDFIPTVTARLTHYLGNGGRSQAACEATRVLPEKGAELPEGVIAYGETAGGGLIYQVAFDFDIGSIQDLTSMMNLDHLDLDFVGCLWEKDTFYLSRKRSPSYEKQSSVRIYAVTLEKTPVGMVVTPNRKNSVYYPNETPGAKVAVTPFTPGEYTVKVSLENVRGEEVKSAEFTTAEAVEKSLDFSPLPYGHYTVTYTVGNAAGTPVITHRGQLASLPADTRKARYDSPYYVWNFRGAHGTPGKLEDYGDMLMRMGVRRTLLDDKLCETNDLVKTYMLTLGEFPFYAPRPKNGQTREEAIDEMKAMMRDKMAKFPHCKTAIIFHESGGGPFPKELIDGHTEVTPEIAKADTNRLQIALTTAKAWREVDPGVRLILGNSGFSVGLLGQLFRAGYPKDLIDAMGDETVGMTQPPERSVAYPAWMLRKLASAYGYDAVPDAPWEWKSRVIRHQGEEDFAAVKVRDALVSHAWKYTCIPLCGLTEMANSYYDTIWGDGCFERWPLAYPHQCFTATATMTLILDCAEFVRMVPTGSATVYCLEFRKPDNSFVYAIWTARANIRVSLASDDASVKKLSIVDMLGEPGKIDVGEYFTVSPRPCYVTTDSQLARFTIDRESMARREPIHAGEVVQPLEDVAEVQLVNGKDPRIDVGREDPPFLSFHKAGEFKVSAVADGIEVARTSTNACPELMQEYAFLKFPNAKPAAGEPTSLGVWVKGNSSWGKLYFELTDAEGEKWLSAGTGGYGCTVYDWPEKASINFDGWHFVEFPITRDSPVKVFSPGENEWQWQRDGDCGNGKIDYPVKVSGLGIGMYPHVLNILEMEETPRSIVLKDLTLF